VLELGHGTGRLLLELCRRGLPVVGIDASPQMGRLARRRLQAAGVPHRPARADARALPFPGGCFRSTLSTFPPEFILDPASLSECYRVLVPGGVLQVLVQAQITGRSWLDRAAAWLFALTGQYRQLRPEWLEPFAAAGFQVEQEEVRLPRARLIRIWARRPL
jgi:ubiquinone/menaquinone biosynthesis C-methylase UbiE